MLNKNVTIATAAVTIALSTGLLLPSATSAQSFDRIYVFGDSLSDIGNVYQATDKENPLSPPYFKGRYSNGPVWVEYLASDLKLPLNLNNNFAYGGATTGDSQSLPLGVLAQIEKFKATKSTSDRNPLYIIWAGANDYLGGGTDTTAPVNNLTNAVKSIAAVGGKNIVVVNLPDLGKLPGTRTSERASILSNLTAKHNRELAAAIDNLRQQLNADIKLKYLDVNSIFNQVGSNPSKYGFTNVTEPCFKVPIKCSNPDRYLFWDNIHPTTAAHKLLVELASPTIKDKSKSSSFSIPQFTILLTALILSILGFGLIAKRRKNSKKR
ncbi:SGNH/GDSL hydrolase family protein [Aerosakkonema sp. BLCC-F183]|uniref:SGNH/GDSL hydrolase family protein n=1 Tax=Aerosakkonema sp. BLCC-F183 TaxID=3342834 RepID=UPI0035BB0A7F